MVIKLYQNSSDPKSVDKQLGTALDISGTALEPLDIVNPVIEVDGDIVSLIAGYNYMYIQDYARYYFIETTADSYHLNQIRGHCDILTSSAPWLRSRLATITRNEKLYNAYLNDPEFNAYAYTNIVLKAFPYGIEQDSIILMTVG